jgi:hypothetical protein
MVFQKISGEQTNLWVQPSPVTLEKTQNRIIGLICLFFASTRFRLVCIHQEDGWLDRWDCNLSVARNANGILKVSRMIFHFYRRRGISFSEVHG